MSLTLLFLAFFCFFAVYRYRGYKKQRTIDTMAEEAQAYVCAEVLGLIQSLNQLLAMPNAVNDSTHKLQQRIQQLTVNSLCHTDSAASVREYLTEARQEISLIQQQLNALKQLQQKQQFDHLK